MGQYGQGELQKVLHLTSKLILFFQHCYFTQNVSMKPFFVEDTACVLKPAAILVVLNMYLVLNLHWCQLCF